MTVSRETVTCGHGHASHPVSRETGRSTHLSPLAHAVLLPVRAYRRFLSPGLAPRCRYYPSCSAYAEESIRELGAIRGLILASWRVVRCNPFSKGGFDAVADRHLFRPASERTEPPC